MLGLASYFGHLLSCLEVARRKGHKLVTIATGKAIGGAFICYGMFADRIYALDSASVGLMPIAAMSAVTKIPAAVLQKLSKTMPSLEFGAEPFALLGGVEEVWPSKGDLQARLAKAIATAAVAVATLGACQQQTAQQLNTVLHRAFPEADVFRIDHFLGKEPALEYVPMPDHLKGKYQYQVLWADSDQTWEDCEKFPLADWPQVSDFWRERGEEPWAG